jgi:hypothetical protein
VTAGGDNDDVDIGVRRSSGQPFRQWEHGASGDGLPGLGSDDVWLKPLDLIGEQVMLASRGEGDEAEALR